MKWLFIAVPAGIQTLLVLRLVWTGLAKHYPALTAWRALSALTMMVLLVFEGPQAPGYRSAWITRQLVDMLALFAALVELTNRILEHYPGLRRATATGLFSLLLLTSVVLTAGESFSKPVRLVLMVQTGWNAATAGYVMGLVAFATYLDPRRRMNVIIHERVFAASCALIATFSLLTAVGHPAAKMSDMVGAVAGVVFPLFWMTMSPAGEADRRLPVSQAAFLPSIAESEATLQRLERLVTRSGD